MFPETASGINENIWEELTLDSFTTTSPQTVAWLDPVPLETGICASYAIIPIDREGNANLQRANITRVDGAAAQLCGDAIPPSTTLEGLSHSWVFTNDTACFSAKTGRCATTTLTWTWPAHEAQGELTWNVYRVETRPVDIDLRFIEPLLSGLTGTPGRKDRSCKAVLIGTVSNPCEPTTTFSHPSHSVGNEMMLANYPSDNIERHIDDDWWSYNQHLIPPEPEPLSPVGHPVAPKLNDAMGVEEFQLAGVALLATIVLNFIPYR